MKDLRNQEWGDTNAPNSGSQTGACQTPLPSLSDGLYTSCLRPQQAAFAPLSPPNSGGRPELKSPRIGGFRGLYRWQELVRNLCISGSPSWGEGFGERAKGSSEVQIGDYRRWLWPLALLGLGPLTATAAIAATMPDGAAAAPTAEPPTLAQVTPRNRPGTSPSLEPLPELEPLQELPAPDQLLGPDFVPPAIPETPLPGDDITVTVEQFAVAGSTVFTQEDFDEVTAAYRDRPITFTDIQAARNAITQLYLDNGYLTSGAIIPPQPIADGVIRIQAIEGGVEDILVTGTTRLQPSYISSRLGLGAQTPLRVATLLEKLQLLQLDPLIERISADLQAGSRPGTNVLVVTVTEADSFNLAYTLDNNRSPSVGSIRHQFQVNERNLTGRGDGIFGSYAVTEGSNDLDLSYTVPLSPHNTTLTAYFSSTDSNVIEEPFDALEASSEATVFELTLRQPLIQTPTEDLALGLIGSHQRTQTFLGVDDIGGFPLSPGADEEGRTRLTALRFFQEWTQRSPEQVVALRSQFNFGLDLLDATNNSEADVPDSQYISWLGQGQWVRLMAPDTLLILRGSAQLTPDPLLTLERYGLGGQATVRGYRQDAVLTDNGVALSLEARFPLWRDPEGDALLQITPFIDSGYGWNTRNANPDPNTLIGVGTGLLLQVDDATFRFDWGIPLISPDGNKDTLQEQGLYFTLNFSFF